MMLQKWNRQKKLYEPYEVPDTWNVSLIERDMKKIVNCVECGKELPFGETLTSCLVHNEMGFGYGVCLDCYYKEHKD